MEYHQLTKDRLRKLVILALILVTGWLAIEITVELVSGATLFVAYFTDILTYFIISLVLSSVLRTPTNYINQTFILGVRVPRGLAILISFLILLAIITLFIILFIPLVRGQIDVISKINYEEVFAEIEKPIEAAENYLYDLGFISAEAAGFNLRTYFSRLLDTEILGKLQNFISGILSTTSNVFVGSLAVIFMTFFLLYEKGILRKTIINLIPNKYFEVSMSALYKVDQLLSNYLLGLLSQMFSIFIVAAFGLKIAGIEYAITIAVFAALANLIPYLGPILGASFGLLVSLSAELASEDPEYLGIILRVGIVFLIVQLMDNLIFQPLIFSRSVKAHPLEIFLAVFVGASLGQAPGMILAIPAYTIVRVAAIELYLGVRQYRVFK